jgi:hypothetical protein
MERTKRLLDYYLPPAAGFSLESLIATTYQVDFSFFEEELLSAALGVRAPMSQLRGFRSELERKLQRTDVSVMYDLGACERLARLSPRIDAIPIIARKLHSKITLLMWIRDSPINDAPPDRRLRIIVGSANLTRQGFRHNYECVVSVDFGGKSTSRRSLLTAAISLVEEISAGMRSPQLTRQLRAFTALAGLLPDGVSGADDPLALVSAVEVVPTIREMWAAISDKPPEAVTIVSPFWAEGETASEALASLFIQPLGAPKKLELVCRGDRSVDGKSWLPIFDGNLALSLRKRLSSRIYLRAALPNTGLSLTQDGADDIGDEMEEKEFEVRARSADTKVPEGQRTLHAKLILVDGPAGSVLYAGSSNCTRRGLGLGGPTNSEAGLLYRLTPRQRKQLHRLLEFAGPASEVHHDDVPATLQPISEEAAMGPTFLAEVVALGSLVTISFRDSVPPDLVVLMPVPTRATDTAYWLLYQANQQTNGVPGPVTVDIQHINTCDEHLAPRPGNSDGQSVQPHVFVEARWQGHSATFPVRFDDKTKLPLLLMGRRPTEGELIEYFLFGTEPGDWEGESIVQGTEFQRPHTDAPIDTRRILAYFIRQFVQAIPGIEAEVRRAGYCWPALDAALRGPTSPLELAERAVSSLTRTAMNHEPAKTATAVGFQLTEILAALGRCRSATIDRELQACFDPVMARCHEMLDRLVPLHGQLQSVGFRLYQKQILGTLE